MIDNYDSFVYNLVRYFKELNEEIVILKNDEVSDTLIHNLRPEGIILSPGPKSPKESSYCLEIINEFKGKVPILGVCLGHQIIAHFFGGEIIHGAKPMHGKISKVYHDEMGVFKGLPQGFEVTRYHSLIVDQTKLPDCLEVTCTARDGDIMGVRHRKYLIEGVQFHPEAELTQHGHQLIKNFINICKKERVCCE